MEAPAIRQRMTLSDQLSVLQSSSNLRDHLRFPDDAAVSAASRGRRGSVTLATVLEAEKISAAAAASNSGSGGGGRTLLDVIREDDDSQSDGEGSPRWRDLTDRLRIRPSDTWRDGSASTSARPEGIRVSLMTLMELREREEEREEERRLAATMAASERDGGGAGDDDVAVSHVCCVCMVRKKGAAFIPCGHTFCRVCSRELFVGRGNCPLCNGPIVEVLDIF